MVSTAMARPHIVIVGAGFGGLARRRMALAGAPADVTVIDRRNYHLFQPLLYQVATAGLSPAADRLADPRHPAPAANVAGAAGQGHGDRHGAPRAWSLDGSRASPYDYLVLATGARHAYFGHDDWESVRARA